MSRTQIVVFISAVLLFIVVLDLVRRRNLREEYSWLWLTAAFFYLLMAFVPGLVNFISSLFGISNAITAFIFFTLLFIVLILIHYSVRLSKLTTQMKNLAQQVAILGGEQNKIEQLVEKDLQKISQQDPTINPEQKDDSVQQVKIVKHKPDKLSQSLD